MNIDALKQASARDLRRATTRRIKSLINPQRYQPLPPQPEVPNTKYRLIIGPANFAGQGFAWARAAERAIPDLYAEALTREVGTFNFPTDDSVSPFRYQFTKWQVQQDLRIKSKFSHALIEAGRPITSSLHGRSISGEVASFANAGISCAVVSHGSDSRIPSHHIAKYPHSPFLDAPADVVATLENRAKILVEAYSKLKIPTFVSTPDLIDDLPNGIWLPVVVDQAKWKNTYLAKAGKITVLYAPSKSWMKGGPKVDEILQSLSEQGIIEYIRIDSVPADDMPRLVKSADVVIDQFALGAYGATAVQAMAAGKVVVGHVAPWVRERIPSAVPIVEATVDQLEEAILKLTKDESLRRELGIQGEKFVTEFHNGTYSGSVLHTWICA